MPSMRKHIECPAVEYGPDPFNPESSLKQKEYTGFTPLLLAITSDRTSFELVKYLILNGANAHAVDFQGNNMLQILIIHKIWDRF